MKDAYYFSHDSNAKDDPKCMLLIDQLGLEGYGIFWVLVEILRDQPEYKYPIDLIPIIARRYNTTPEKMKAVVLNYNLFNFDNENNFFSLSLNNRMEHLADVREKRRIAGLASGQARKQKALNKCSTNVQHKQNKNEQSKEKESKEKESKEKESKTDININFYRNQIESLNGEKYVKEYKMIFDYISGKNDLERQLNEILSFPEQLTYKQFEKLFDKSKQKEFSFKETLMTITNKKDYWHKKTSLYLTLNGWINRSKNK